MIGRPDLMIEANGLRFATDEAGTGDAVALCLHGFPENRHSWRRQLPALASLGWRAVAPDLRGYGASSRPAAPEAYRIEALVADVSAMFDALGAKRRLLVGHDWGGMVAWAFALAHARPLDGLIVLNIPHPARFAHALKHSWRQRLRSWYALAFQLPWLPERLLTARHAALVERAVLGSMQHPGWMPADVLASWRDDACCPGAMTAMLNYYRANLGRIGAMTERAPLDTPTLMIWGEEDTALDRSLIPGTEALVRDFTVHRLPGISHWVQQEAPDEVNAAIEAWLGERSLAPPA